MPLKFTDDYEWSTYTDEYAKETERAEGQVGRNFLINSWTIDANGLPVFADNIDDSWAAIYTAAYALKPATVFECGCGSMYHLRNISKLLPATKVYGCDLLISQLHFGSVKWQIGYDILKNVRVRDLTQPDATSELGVYEFVYTQAVIMHLAYPKAVAFVRNMMALSSKHIMIVENPSFQDFDSVWRETGIASQFDVKSAAVPDRTAWLFTRRST